MSTHNDLIEELELAALLSDDDDLLLRAAEALKSLQTSGKDHLLAESMLLASEASDGFDEAHGKPNDEWSEAARTATRKLIASEVLRDRYQDKGDLT